MWKEKETDTSSAYHTENLRYQQKEGKTDLLVGVAIVSGTKHPVKGKPGLNQYRSMKIPVLGAMGGNST